MAPLPSKRRRGVKTFWNIFYHLKHLPAKFGPILLVSSQYVQKFVFHFYGTPPFQKRDGRSTIIGIYLLFLKTSTCQIRFNLLGLFLSCAQIYVSFVWDPTLPEDGGVSNYHRNLYRHQKLLPTNFHVDRFGSFRAYMDQTDRQTGCIFICIDYNINIF